MALSAPHTAADGIPFTAICGPQVSPQVGKIAAAESALEPLSLVQTIHPPHCVCSVRSEMFAYLKNAAPGNADKIANWQQ